MLSKEKPSDISRETRSYRKGKCKPCVARQFSRLPPALTTDCAPSSPPCAAAVSAAIMFIAVATSIGETDVLASESDAGAGACVVALVREASTAGTCSMFTWMIQSGRHSNQNCIEQPILHLTFQATTSTNIDLKGDVWFSWFGLCKGKPVFVLQAGACTHYKF